MCVWRTKKLFSFFRSFVYVCDLLAARSGSLVALILFTAHCLSLTTVPSFAFFSPVDVAAHIGPAIDIAVQVIVSPLYFSTLLYHRSLLSPRSPETVVAPSEPHFAIVSFMIIVTLIKFIFSQTLALAAVVIYGRQSSFLGTQTNTQTSTL